MPTLLVVHHTTSPATQELLDAVLDGTHAQGLAGVDVVVRAALGTGVSDVLAADGFVLGTPANFGYMSGALKHFFDVVYYPCLNARPAAPYGLYTHGNNDTTGAIRAVESLAKGIGWQRVLEPVSVIGAPGKSDLEAVWELGATVGAHLAGSA